MTKRILIADDEPSVRELLELVLRDNGYEVLSAQNGDQLVRMAQETVPDLVIVDLMMPGVDGYEAIRQLRNDTRTSHIPTIILTARSTPSDLVIGFETGADDYVTKPFNIPELLARVMGHLRRAAQLPVNNPLTGLPGNILLTEELKHRLKRGEPFALLHIDLNNFKAFNDTYGFARGDRMIKLVAEVLIESVQAHGTGSDFIGHIGGDDFAMLTSPDIIDPLCADIIATFDQRARALYDSQDLQRGYLQGIDRDGVTRRFPIITLSIGIATNRRRSFDNYENVSRIAADMKHYAKQQPGSFYAVDVRTANDRDVPEDRRGRWLPTVALLIPDAGLSDWLRGALQREGYRTLQAPNIPEANALMTHVSDLSLVVADVQLGDSFWEFVETCRTGRPSVPLLICSTRAADEQIAHAHGAGVYIQQPFQIHQFLACVAQLARREE